MNNPNQITFVQALIDGVASYNDIDRFRTYLLDICETALADEGFEVLGGNNANERLVIAPNGNRYRLSLNVEDERTYRAIAYEDDGTVADAEDFDDLSEAIEFAKSHNGDAVIDLQTNENAWNR